MEKYLKNKTLLIAAAVVVVLVVLAGVFFVISSKNLSNQQANATPLPTDTPIPSIAPSDLGITLTWGQGNKTAILNISDTQDINSLSYELSYMATVNGAQVARGAIGDITIKQKGSPIRQEMVLGTCSDVCHYDSGITDVKLTLKITKTDGKTYQSQLTLDTQTPQ